MVKTFKQFENTIRNVKSVFEHEPRTFTGQNIKAKRSNLMTQFVVEVRSFTYM